MTTPQPRTGLMVRVRPIVVTRWLMMVAIAFFIAAIAIVATSPSESGSLVGEALSSLRRLFDPDLEANIATWFATALLLGGAMLAGLVAKAKIDAKDALRHHWVGLALVLLLMSMDEAGQIHEMLIKPTQSLLGASDSSGWVWTLPALVVVAILARLSLRLVRSLPWSTRRLLLLSFSLFLFGAVGVEIVGSVFFGQGRGTGFEIAAAIEELIELTAAILFITTMLEVLGRIGIGVAFDKVEGQPNDHRGRPLDEALSPQRSVVQ